MNSTQLGTLILWCFLWPHLIFLILFYFNRFLYPINARSPKAAIAMNVSMFLFATLQWLQVEFDCYCQIIKWSQFLLVAFFQAALNYRMVQLLFAYEITKNIAELKDNKNLSQWRPTWITRNRYLAQNPFMIKLAACMFACYVVTIIVVSVAYPGLNMAPCNRPFDTVVQDLTTVRSVIGLIFTAILAAKMWKYPNDAFGIKSEFKLCFVAPVSIMLGFFIIRGFFPSVTEFLPGILILIVNVLPYISIIMPYYQSVKALQTEEFTGNGDLHLNQLLKRPEGIRAFLDYLKTEFSSENLLFWLEVESFKKAITTGKSLREVIAKATQIHEKFLKLDAPCLINLPHEVSESTNQRVTQLIEKEGAGQEPENFHDLFDRAADEIYRLMSADSFCRFQRTSSYERMKSIFRDNSSKSHHLQVVTKDSHNSGEKKIIMEEEADSRMEFSASYQQTLLQPRTVPSSPSRDADEFPTKQSQATALMLDTLRLAESSFITESPLQPSRNYRKDSSLTESPLQPPSLTIHEPIDRLALEAEQ